MVDVLAAMPAGRRIVIAGEMLELGPRVKRCTATQAVNIAGSELMF